MKKETLKKIDKNTYLHSYRSQDKKKNKKGSFRTKIKHTPKYLLTALNKQQRYFEDK